jgi:hypothetical protein
VKHDPADLTQRELWTGEFYMLAMAFGPLDDEELAGVQAAVVEHADLRTPKRGGRWGYVARLPSGKRVVCRVDRGRENDGCYATLYFPAEALTLTDRRVRKAFLDFDSPPDEFVAGWFRALDDWLASVAMRVHEVWPIRGGRIGWEVTAENLVITGRPPAVRGHGLLVVRDGVLEYLPAT